MPMPEWLSRLLDSFAFKAIVKAIGGTTLFIALVSYIVIGFIQDRRRIKRGEPFKFWYLREPVYPGDPMYNYYAWQRLLPAYTLFVVFVLIAVLLLGAIGYEAIWGAPHPSQP
jgi:hypothetical protein